ncbi:BolA family protein [Sandaracinus amylolyticus]|uniref:Cell division protein BolA n=1 Tax=Sandaracinus amylolyticus TaxID=927083 RepID=A0A0F6W2L4_9BACT|nr:BolA family transcriptional regulator [Sandaracinus amylolyticus]AKF05842.1 Cell division protein BolA [Sandaracinus amylolyticus]
MVEPETLEQRIRSAMPDVELVRIEDLTGTKDHYQAVVVSPSFAGMTRVEQHQSVYRALGELMAGPVHALALQTYTPEAWKKKNG